jgi:hypothetical protein
MNPHDFDGFSLDPIHDDKGLRECQLPDRAAAVGLEIVCYFRRPPDLHQA